MDRQCGEHGVLAGSQPLGVQVQDTSLDAKVEAGKGTNKNNAETQGN